MAYPFLPSSLVRAILWPKKGASDQSFKEVLPKPVWLSGQNISLWAERSQVRFRSRECTLVVGTFPVGGVQEEAADRCFSLIDVSGFLSLSLPLYEKNQ